MPLKVLSFLALLALLASPACAARRSAPPPARPVAASLYAGRWYEIARTPNRMQSNCDGATSDFENFAAGAFQVRQTCHQGAPSGPAKVLHAHAQIVAGSENTRFRMAFFGGLVHQEYWILDHSADGEWAIMATPGGNYAWLLARRPTLPPAALSAAMARLHELGYDHLALTPQ